MSGVLLRVYSIRKDRLCPFNTGLDPFVPTWFLYRRPYVSVLIVGQRVKSGLGRRLVLPRRRVCDLTQGTVVFPWSPYTLLPFRTYLQGADVGYRDLVSLPTRSSLCIQGS